MIHFEDAHDNYNELVLRNSVEIGRIFVHVDGGWTVKLLDGVCLRRSELLTIANRLDELPPL